VADGKVFFGAGDDGLYGLDAVTGTKLWQSQGPWHVDTSPVAAGGRLYAGSGVSRRNRTTEVFCLDADTGQVLWRTPTHLPVWGSPRVDGGQVFFGLGNGRLDRSAEPPEQPAGALLCVRADDGRVAWSYDLPNAVLAKPALGQEHVYFGARDGCCYCLSRHDGRLCWRQDVGSPVVTTPALVDQRLYVAPSGGRVCCLDTGSGKPNWTFDVASHSQTRPQLFSSPAAVAEGGQGQGRHRIYFGAELRTSAGSAAAVFCLQDEQTLSGMRSEGP
jgi:outer membrane protein assembly factor BamB